MERRLRVKWLTHGPKNLKDTHNAWNNEGLV